MMKHLTHDNILQMEQRYRAKFINSLSGFKSANLIGTKSEYGSNLAIISSVVHLGANPPLIGFITRPNLAPRHTYDNIIESSHYTINHVNESIYENAHQTSARYERDESEFKFTGLTEEYLDNFPAPFVKESNLKMGIKLIREINIAENDTNFIIGEIQSIYVDELAIQEDGHIDLEFLNTLCVSGLDSYHKTNLIKRLPYAKK